MLQSLITQLGAGAIAAVCLYALFAGTWRERFGAIIYSTGYLVTLGFGLGSRDNLAVYLLLADVICLLGFYITCFKAQHPWPQWALLGQIICVAVDLSVLLNIGLPVNVFLIIQTVAGWCVLMALLLGTIAAAQVRRDARKPALRKTL